MPVHHELKQILVCPRCKGSLVFEDERDEIACHACWLVYGVTDGIPVMLVEHARPMPPPSGEGPPRG